MPNEGNAVQLAKLLSTCLIVRGSQLSVLRRLSSPYIVQIQTNLLSWIAKKIAGYEKNKNKKGLKTAIVFFRVLVPLLNSLPSVDALKVYVFSTFIFFSDADLRAQKSAHGSDFGSSQSRDLDEPQALGTATSLRKEVKHDYGQRKP